MTRQVFFKFPNFGPIAGCIALTTLLFAGCSSEGQSGAGATVQSSGLTEDQFCDEYAALVCANDRHCCSDPEAIDDGCEGRQWLDCSVGLQYLERSFHPPTARKYLDLLRLRAEKCQTPPWSLSVTESYVLDNGEACRTPWQSQDPDVCRAGYCDFDYDRDEHVCTPWKEIGQACGDSEECGPGSTCREVDETPLDGFSRSSECVPGATEGGACSLEQPCEGGLICIDSACRVGDQANGAACDDEFDCQGFCDLSTGTCAACSTDDDCMGAECLEGLCSLYGQTPEDIDEEYCVSRIPENLR